ncbi:hypothetical protein FJZ21_00075 [Candidatus Pacearchaeota archaeon]|nr:hypothetical protein [Candidatus Pacearchaeota archaeon]
MAILKSQSLRRETKFLLYRFRYLINYIIIGLFSVGLEILIVHYLNILESPSLISIPLGFISGVFISFLLNSRLNFRVPKGRNAKTFSIFLSIAVVAFLLNLLIMSVLFGGINSNYGPSRLFTAGVVFLLSYFAHRKITFTDFVKKVGVAVYLKKDESIEDVYSKIKYYSDFIHIDFVDKSMSEEAEEIDLPLIKKISSVWFLEKQLHIMSKTPSIWIKKLHKYVDVITVHLEVNEVLDEVIDLCKSFNKKVGIVITIKSDLDKLKKYLKKIDYIQVMGIEEVGKSGQNFTIDSLSLLEKVNSLNLNGIKVIFDGGVKPTNIQKINARYIVSASSLINSDDPIKSFMELKTSARYSSLSETIRKDIVDEINKIVRSNKFLVSGNLVGTFAETYDLEGASDIDTVIIFDKLSKDNFLKVLNDFKDLSKCLESKYGIKFLINNTLGPLKFNDRCIVFHLMFYDIESHRLHCLDSPFTCFDWQRSRKYSKKPIERIYSVKLLQPSFFFNSRRSVSDYLKDLKSGNISYRSYAFDKKGNVVEEKNFKEMDSRHKIEFSYHICKFLILNFLKLYNRRNSKPDFDKMLDNYFKIFKKNAIWHRSLIEKMYSDKLKRNFGFEKSIESSLEKFLKDFESQFKDYFYSGKQISFIRHAPTEMNKEGLFLGQKTDIGIKNLKKKLDFSDFDLVFSSPLKRCLETLEHSKAKKAKKDKRLIEVDYGLVDGKDFSFLQKNYPGIVDSWDLGEDTAFPSGENNADVQKRMFSFVKDLRRYSHKKILVCTHNVFLRSLVGTYSNIPVKDWHKIKIDHLDEIKGVISKDGRFFLELNRDQIERMFSKL